MNWFELITDKCSEDCNIIMLHNKCGQWEESCHKQSDINTNNNNTIKPTKMELNNHNNKRWSLYFSIINIT